MASLLSNLADNLAERINKIQCKDCDCFLEYESVNLNMEDITDADYIHVKRVCKDFEKKI